MMARVPDDYAGAPKNEAGAPELQVANVPAGKVRIAVGAEKAKY